MLLLSYRQLRVNWKKHNEWRFKLTKYRDFDGGINRARRVLQYNIVRSSVWALGIFYHQQRLIVGCLQLQSMLPILSIHWKIAAE